MQNSAVRDETNGTSERVISDEFYPPLMSSSVFDIGQVGFQGIGHTLDPENPYVFPILRAESSTYSKQDYKDFKEVSKVGGQQLSLVSGYQSYSNNRAVIAGSIEMCSDEFLAEHEHNVVFCTQLLDWTMQESGVLRSTGLRHSRQGTPFGDSNPENYNLEEHVTFEIDLEKKTRGVWEPF